MARSRFTFDKLISGSRIRTYDLKIMSLASYQTALSRSLCFFVADLTPRGIRIPVSSVKGRCPGPLDDGGFLFFFCVENSYLSFLKITESKEAIFFIWSRMVKTITIIPYFYHLCQSLFSLVDSTLGANKHLSRRRSTESSIDTFNFLSAEFSGFSRSQRRRCLFLKRENQRVRKEAIHLN
jgi:hypothetical protein